jgi:hypothetical protein
MTTTYAFNTPCNFVCKNETLATTNTLTPQNKTEILKILKKFNIYYDPDNDDADADIISKFKVLLSTLQSCGDKYKEGIEIVRPWTRFRTTCPSNEFKELNMRRKAEVLKYTNNANKLSKKQRYSMAARNLLTKRKSWANQKLGQESNPNTSNLKPTGYFSNNFDNTSNLSWSGLSSCKATKPVSPIPSNNNNNNNYQSKNEELEPKILKFPTSASDVPGKPMDLYLDPNAPLTMYTPVRRTYQAGANKWPQFGWYPGLRGFPVGKKGSLFP